MWRIGDESLASRLLLGTALYPSPQIMVDAVRAAGADIITVSLRRETGQAKQGTPFWDYLKSLNKRILPNTAGCRSVREAVAVAQLARQFFQTNWMKLEVIGDDLTLQPDTAATVEAAAILVKDGFEVFPYTTEDLVVAEKLLRAGCRIVMPWGSYIGSGNGLNNLAGLKMLRERLPEAIMIIDAGIGKPSQAAHAMELGFDAVLLNSAVAKARSPVAMARAFAEATRAGRTAFEAGMIPALKHAAASTPVVGTPFWQEHPHA